MTRDWREAIYRLGDFPHQFDLQQSALERSALDLDIIGQVERPPERTRRDALIEVLMITLFGLRSLDVDGLPSPPSLVDACVTITRV